MHDNTFTTVITLAWRNVWKNRRRTVLTLLTIMVGCAMIIFMKAMQEGGYGQMIEDAVRANTGHIQIHEKGFFDAMTIDYAFRPAPAIIKTLRNTPEISSFTMRVHAAGLISGGTTTEGVMIQGDDPSAERNVTTLHQYILKGGRYLNPEDRKQIIMGETLAKNLEVRVGDTVSLLSKGFDGSIAADNLTIAGLFRSGNPEYDRMLVIMPLEEAKEIFSMMGYMTSIVIRLKDGTQMAEVRRSLRSRIASPDLEIMGYDELMPDMMQYILMDRVSGYVFYIILFMVVAFGVLNTIQMSVYERIRELGVMLAIGTRPGQIRSMVVLEAVFISVSGIILGIILGSALSWYFTIHPIDYSSYAREMEVWGIATTVFPARLEVSNILSTSAITFVISILFTLFPAHRASRLKPIEAIRKL